LRHDKEWEEKENSQKEEKRKWRRSKQTKYHQLLEEQLASVGDVNLRDARCVLAPTALEGVLLQVGDGDQAWWEWREGKDNEHEGCVSSHWVGTAEKKRQSKNKMQHKGTKARRVA
jgi:hypothetical protein